MNKLSTENLNLLPTPEELKQLCKSISALEAIISPEWEYRYYSYQKDWSETEEFCEMRNGEGDQMLILFGNDGTCINGFAHESKMNRREKSITEKLLGSKIEMNKGIVDELPEVYHEFIFGEPVKSIGTTFCIWTTTENTWTTGQIELPNDDYKDGSSDLLHVLDGKALTYKKWAEDYYEEEFENRELKLELINKIYAGTIISRAIVLAINPEFEDFEKLESDLNDIGYENEI